MAEGLTLGGLDVMNRAIGARDLSGVLTVPERRGDDVEIPGRNGVVRTPRKTYGARRAVFEFVVTGRRPDGTLPTDPGRQFYANLSALAEVLAQDQAPLVHSASWWPDAPRQIDVEALSGIDPTRWRGGTSATLPIAFSAPEAFWRAAAPTDVAFALPAGGTRELVEFATSDAPIDDPLLTIGPSTNPVLTQTESGLFVAYDLEIPAGGVLRLDCATWDPYGSTGFTFDRRRLRTPDVPAAPARWFGVDPVVGAPPTVRLDHNGGTALVDVTISARQSWLFG